MTAWALPMAAIWPAEVRALDYLLLGDVAGILDHLEGLAVQVENRIVGGL